MNPTYDIAPHDAALRAAILAAADLPRLDALAGAPPIAERFLVALGDRLALGFPAAAAALRTRALTGLPVTAALAESTGVGAAHAGTPPVPTTPVIPVAHATIDGPAVAAPQRQPEHPQ